MCVSPPLPAHLLQDKRVIAMSPLGEADSRKYNLPPGQWVGAEVRRRAARFRPGSFPLRCALASAAGSCSPPRVAARVL